MKDHVPAANDISMSLLVKLWSLPNFKWRACLLQNSAKKGAGDGPALSILTQNLKICPSSALAL